MKQDKSEIDWFEKVYKTLFSSQPLTKGEYVQIILVTLLILSMILVYFKTSCTLNCSMCTESTQIIKQTGFGW